MGGPIPESSMLESGASSAMGTASQNSPDKIAAFVELLKAVTSGNGLSSKTPLTTMQPTMGTPREPQAPFNAGSGEIPQGSFQTHGEAKRAELQSMINNVSSMVQKGQDYMHQKKVRDMQSKTERLMGAFQGMEQAKASGDQGALKQNQDIINDMFSDPKNVKLFQKAFDVKLLGDDKGKATPEHQGLTKAMQEWQKGGKEGLNPMADKFTKQMPSQAGINPALAAMAQLIKAKILPSADKMAEQQTEVIKQVGDTLRAGFNNESKEKIATMMTDAKDRGTQSSILRTILQEEGRNGAAEIMARSRVKAATISANAAMQDTQWRMAGEILKTRSKTAGESKLVQKLSTEHQRVSDEIKDAEKQLKGITTWDSAKDWWNNQNRAGSIQQHLDELRKTQSSLLNSMSQLNLGGDDGSGSGNSGQGNEATDFDKFFESQESELISSGDKE